MSVKEFLDHLALRNSLNRARWAWRWAQQGGTYFTTARPLQDLRNDDDMARWRKIEYTRSKLAGFNRIRRYHGS